MKFRVTQPIYAALLSLLRHMEAKQHGTGFFELPIEFASGGSSRMFAFVTLDEETASRAREALEKANCLPGEEVQG